MDLKDLYEDFDSDTIKEIIGDYLSERPEYRLQNNFEDYLFELKVCPICGQINKEDCMTYHAWDLGGIEGLICESCRNDEEF